MTVYKKDKLFLGVDFEKIKNSPIGLNPDQWELFLKYITNRQEVHNRKFFEQKEKPWTDDPILQNYRFTNVRREDDRVSKALIRTISLNPTLTLEEKIYNSILFRAWNNEHTVHKLGGPWTMQELPNAKTKAFSLYKTSAPDTFWFSSAYNQGGSKAAWKYPDLSKTQEPEINIPLRPFHLINYMFELDTVRRIMEAQDQQEVYTILLELPGVAAFLAYQLFVDLTYIPEFQFTENHFVVSGPGCTNGINALYENRHGLTDEELIWQLYYILNTHYTNYLEYMFRYYTNKEISVMSIENCLCEFSKYSRTFHGTGRPKVTYNGV